MCNPPIHITSRREHLKNWNFIAIIYLLIFSMGVQQNVDAQDNLAQQAYAIFEQNCLNCHGQHGAYTEALIIEHTALIETGAVIPGNPNGSEFYRRLIETTVAKRMPLGQPPLTPAAIDTIQLGSLQARQIGRTLLKQVAPSSHPKKCLRRSKSTSNRSCLLTALSHAILH